MFRRVDERRIGEILVEDYGTRKHYIEEVLAHKDVMSASSGKRLKFGEVASNLGLVSEETVSEALARQFSSFDGKTPLRYVPHLDAKYRINMNLISMEAVSSQFDGPKGILEGARDHGIFPMYVDEEADGSRKLVVGITSPIGADGDDDSIAAVSHIYKFVKIPEASNGVFSSVEVVLVARKTLQYYLDTYKCVTKEELNAMGRGELAADAKMFLKSLLVYCIVNEASDIHMRPAVGGNYRISMRIRGELETIDIVNGRFASSAINLIKQYANIPMDEIYKPQDGVIVGKEVIDSLVLPVDRLISPQFNYDRNSFRVSTYPVEPAPDADIDAISESVVLRSLTSDVGFAKLESLGLSEETIREISFATSRNQGIIIVVGPTGSGKTTTLYATLSKMDCVREHIISFEDPVEIRNMYWSQGQKRDSDIEKASFGFLDASRAILRQDPDIILMGEIRDETTASFALKSANTGHLVFTTLHANSASEAIPRLDDLGVERTDMVSSILCIVSQRLVRKLCPSCSVESSVTDEEREFLARLGIDPEALPEKTRRKGEGCIVCNGSGFVGREVIDEVLPFDKEIREVVSAKATGMEIRDLLDGKGFGRMVVSGLRKVESGITSIEEILRVV